MEIILREKNPKHESFKEQEFTSKNWKWYEKYTTCKCGRTSLYLYYFL